MVLHSSLALALLFGTLSHQAGGGPGAEAQATSSAPNTSARSSDSASIQVLREYHRESLETVKWAIGGVFTLVAGGLILLTLIAGVNLLVYHRRYEQDKAAFLSEIQREVSVRLAEAHKDLAEEHSRLLQGVSQKQEQDLASLKKHLVENAASGDRQVLGEIHQMRLDVLLKEMVRRCKINLAPTSSSRSQVLSS